MDTQVQESIQERFKRLPKIVQDAIMSADVEKHLREMATSHKLHLDQWELLENQVMYTLLGMEDSADLEKNIIGKVGVSENVARELAQGISKIVFEPIRQELERELEHPEAKKEEVSGVEAARAEVLREAPGTEPVPPAPTAQVQPVQPATPPKPAPDVKVERGPASGAYKPGEASTARKNVVDDPYREPPA